MITRSMIFTQAIAIDPKYVRERSTIEALAWGRKRGKLDNALSDLRYFADIDPSYSDAQKAIARVSAAKKKSEVKTINRTPTQQCPSDRSVAWSNCQGTYTWGENSKYTGQFKDNKPNGHGTITNGDIIYYVGEFKDNKFDSPGTTYFPGQRN